MTKKLYTTVLIALVLASGLALASCVTDRDPGGIPLNNGANCTKQGFPQCGLDGLH